MNEVGVAIAGETKDLVAAGAEPLAIVTAARDRALTVAPDLPPAALDDDIAGLAEHLRQGWGRVTPGTTGLLVLLEEWSTDDPDVLVARLDISGTAGYPDADDWPFQFRWDGGHPATPGLEALLPAGGPDEGGAVSYGLVLAHAVAVTLGAVTELGAEALLGERPALGIACGHHDGDMLLVAHVDGGGVTRPGRWV